MVDIRAEWCIMHIVATTRLEDHMLSAALRVPDFEQALASRKEALNNAIATLDLALKDHSRIAEKEQFSELFSEVVAILEINELELASLFKVSRPTVGRWKRSDAAPHPLGRASVFEALKAIARRKVALS